jgi:vacuolar-type H+-ATPase subunit F/Vma7
MALSTKILPGFSASMFLQPGANPTPLATAAMGVLATVQAIAVAGNLLEVEAITAFGQEDAVVSFMVAGSRQSDKIPVQSPPVSLELTAAFKPSDTNILLVRADAYSGIIDRTYVIAAVEGANILYYSFNARASGFRSLFEPGQEGQVTFNLHPRGNQFNWVNT